MDSVQLLLIVLLVLVLGLTVTGLTVATRRRRPTRRVTPGQGAGAVPAPEAAPAAAPERPRPAEEIPPPPAPDLLPEQEAPAAPGVVTPTPPAEAPATVERERPAPVGGRMTRLRARLARSNSALGQGLLSLLSRDRIDEATWDEVEETLLLADVGVGPSTELVDRLRQRVAVLGTGELDQVRAMLREELIDLVDAGLDRELAVERHADRPAVVLMVGVNGSGKTTTVGKLARVLVARDKDVVLGAADTFRAAAAEQLRTWGDRVGVPTVASDREGADPASVAFDAVKAGIESEADVVLVDTAGRLQNKVGLMDELGKVKRVVERHGPVDEVLLVLDATTGQNGMQQARVFSEVVDVTGIVLTKLDGTAKGGIVVAVQRELGVPVKLVGLGEGPDDLAPFEPDAFVDALLS